MGFFSAPDKKSLSALAVALFQSMGCSFTAESRPSRTPQQPPEPGTLAVSCDNGPEKQADAVTLQRTGAKVKAQTPDGKPLAEGENCTVSPRHALAEISCQTAGSAITVETGEKFSLAADSQEMEYDDTAFGPQKIETTIDTKCAVQKKSPGHSL